MNRNAIGYDINSNAIRIANTRVSGVEGEGKIAIKEGNAENLIDIKNNTIDLICTHPPYASIIKYSEDLKNDLSLLELNDFYKAMNNVASESYRVLKPNKYCAVLMGDTRRNGYIVPLGFSVMNIFLKSGFKIKEIIIKQQHNCSSTKYWQELSIKRNFYLIAHEYLFVFKKV